MRFRIPAILCCLALLVGSPLAMAQSNLNEEQKATVLFDIRVKMMRDGALVNSLGLTDEDRSMLQASAGGELDASSIDRIFGAMTLPDSVQGFEELQNPTGDLPIDFYVQIKFANAEAAKGFYDNMSGDSETEEINGKTYLKPTDGPTNLLAQQVDETTMEMGTRTYILQSARGSDLFSKGLATAWEKAPNHAIRMAVDLEGERTLINEAIEMAKSQSNDATTAAYLGLIQGANDVRISLDLDNATLFEMGMTTGDSDSAQELKGGLDSLLTTAKMMGPMAAQQIPDPGVQKLVQDIVASLAAEAEGNNVRVAIPRPAGMNEAVKSAVDQAKMMFMPPGDFGGN